MFVAKWGVGVVNLGVGFHSIPLCRPSRPGKTKTSLALLARP